MRKILNILGIADMAAGFRNIRTITLTAVLIALTIVGNRILIIPIMPGLEIRFGFIFLASIAFLLGPISAFAAGFLASMLGFILFPSGFPFDPRFYLNAGLSGVIFALFLYKRNPKSEYFIIWILAGRLAVNLINNIIINTYLFRGHFLAAAEIVATARVFRNVVLLPVEIIMMLAVIKFIANYSERYNFINNNNNKEKGSNL